MFSRVHVVRAEFRNSASINRVLSKDRRVIDDRSIVPRYSRGVLRILPITASVIDIEPRGGYRLDTIDSAPGVSPAWTIYNVNIPEPGSTLFSRPFSFLFVLFHFFIYRVFLARERGERGNGQSFRVSRVRINERWYWMDRAHNN